MKRAIFLSALISLSFVAVVGQQKPVAPPESGTWANVAPDKAGFTILMPSKPSESTAPVEGRPDTINYTLTLETELAAYVVSYVQFPDAVTDPDTIKTILDSGRDGGVAASKGELTSEKEIKLGEYFGREWTMKLPGEILTRTRCYWVKRRLYQAVFVMNPKESDTAAMVKSRQEAASKFLDSLKLTPEAGN